MSQSTVKQADNVMQENSGTVPHRFSCEPVLTQGQLDEAKKVRQAVFVEEQQVAPNEEWDEWDSPEAVFKPDCNDISHWVIRDQEAPDQPVVATARLRKVSNGMTYGKVERVAVLPAYRQYGLGRLLMQHLEAGAQTLGFTVLKLHAQCQCQGFYDKLGYAPVDGKTFMEAEIEHIAMQKVL